MRMVDLILKKRAGGEHGREEILFIIDNYVKGEIPDYQMSAWMMAVCFKGMTDAETAMLTDAMANSGDVAKLSDLPGVKVDKHSTGGVGDTTTLVVAPLVAACGGTVAKMSGRGLGHTGGTLDKLEAVPGVCVEQSIEKFKDIVREIGLCVIGQSGNLVPADKKMYALRDVTGTVESLPLMASSIMSKKIAAGTDAIVLDVKYGTGAFMPNVAAAEGLARVMVDIGKHMGRRVMAVISDMNQPLGMAVGNALEVREAVDVLRGRVGREDPLYRVCMTLGACMLQLCELAKDEAEAEAKLEAALRSGAGLKRLEGMLAALGARDAKAVVENPDSLCAARRVVPLTLGRAGYVGNMRANQIGSAAQMLGAGRASKEDVIDPAVGIVLKKRRGAYIEKDETFAELHVNEEKGLADAMELLRAAVDVQAEAPEAHPVIHAIIKG